MSRPCTICISPSAGAINELLRSGRPAQVVADEFGVGHRSMQRHAKAHLGRLVALTPIATNDVLVGDPLEELVVALRGRALAGDPVVAREYRLALAAQTVAMHATAPRRDLASEPEWIAVRTNMLKALQPYPEARRAVADALAKGQKFPTSGTLGGMD
jgi:hypothetical protein